MGLLFNLGVNIWVAALAGLLLGTLGGMLNGLLVARVRLPALVVTLGTYAFYRGMAYVFLGDQAARDYPAAFTYLGQGKTAGTLIPFSVALFVVLAIIFGLVLHKTTFGRYLYLRLETIKNATIYSGVPVARIKIIIFTLSGFMAALAGLILAARFGSTRPDIGTGLELSVITAAVLGGVDINGGSGHNVRRGPVAAPDWLDALRDGIAQYPGTGPGDRDWPVAHFFHPGAQCRPAILNHETSAIIAAASWLRWP